MAFRRSERTETWRSRRASERVRNAERSYSRALGKICRHITDLIKGFNFDHPLKDSTALTSLLNQYGQAIAPWAESTAARMLDDVRRRNAQAWEQHSEKMAKALRQTWRREPEGLAARRLMAEQVDLITSLPRGAAQRVHKLAQEATATGSRGEDIVAEIMKTGAVTRSRAELIARTEVGRAASAIMEARAKSVGSTQYVWRTVGDHRVRLLHRELNGRTFRWDDPPVAGENGEKAHPGAIYNCRCYAEPIIPDDL